MHHPQPAADCDVHCLTCVFEEAARQGLRAEQGHLDLWAPSEHHIAQMCTLAKMSALTGVSARCMTRDQWVTRQAGARRRQRVQYRPHVHIGAQGVRPQGRRRALRAPPPARAPGGADVRRRPGASCSQLPPVCWRARMCSALCIVSRCGQFGYVCAWDCGVFVLRKTRGSWRLQPRVLVCVFANGLGCCFTVIVKHDFWCSSTMRVGSSAGCKRACTPHLSLRFGAPALLIASIGKRCFLARPGLGVCRLLRWSWPPRLGPRAAPARRSAASAAAPCPRRWRWASARRARSRSARWRPTTRT
jgi:hypothetical protein